MGKRRADQAPVGLTSNGVLVVNIFGFLSAQQAGKVRACLPSQLGTDWFVGVAIEGEDTERVLTRLDDAAAEAAATIAGRSHGPSRQRKPPTPKPAKLVAKAKRRRLK